MTVKELGSAVGTAVGVMVDPVVGVVVSPVVGVLSPVVGPLVGPAVVVDGEVEPGEFVVGGELDGEVVLEVGEAKPVVDGPALPHAVNCKPNSKRAITPNPKRRLLLTLDSLPPDQWFKLGRILNIGDLFTTSLTSGLANGA